MKFENPNIYTADEGKTFRRKTDHFIMGARICLYNDIDGNLDAIENYEEIEDVNSDSQNDEPRKSTNFRMLKNRRHNII